MNGALTIGTLDGANVEIMEEVGEENIFIFGLTAPQVADIWARGNDPRRWYEGDAELKRAVDMIAGGAFSPGEPGLFAPIIDNLLNKGDHYLVLADYRAYILAQERAGALYQDKEEWTRRSILNTANMGKFSSDRAVLEYARDIWDIPPLRD
jgi:starch phosphorylase